MQDIVYAIRWSEEDQEWVATCDKFPSLSWLAGSPTAALVRLVKMVRDTAADLQAA